MGDGQPPKRSAFKRAVQPSAATISSPLGSNASAPVAQDGASAAGRRAAGTKASVFIKNSVTTSSGLPSLDSALGGGYAIGTLVCIVEDAPSTCHSLLTNHFVAQGLAHQHDVLYVSEDARALEQTPSPYVVETSSSPAASKPVPNGGGEELKIAWRYKASLSPMAKSAASSDDSYSSKFDISRPLAPEVRAQVKHIRPSMLNSSRQSTLKELSVHLTSMISASKTVCRLVLPTLGSPDWMNQGTREDCERELLCFIRSLKGFLRSRQAVGLFSVPPWIAHTDLGSQILRIADTAIQLDSLASCPVPVRQQFKDYSAFLHLRKVLRMASLATFTPDSIHFLLKVRRKMISLDRMHATLPEGAPDDSKPQNPNAKPSAKQLEF